jgi:hypothetical protein
MNRRSATFALVLISATLGLAAAPSAERSVTPATVVMQLPAAMGGMERPAVEFNHAVHTAALEQEGCETCHSTVEGAPTPRLEPRLKGTLDADDRDGMIDAYHDACMTCHNTRTAASLSSGPVTCGECHVRRPPGVSQRVEMAFDYSLHARHSKAYPEKCETCHHVYDEQQQKLVYQKGTEEACRSCHGTEDVERTLSLANASHTDCVGCHLELTRTAKVAGPVLCVGCHEASHREAIDTLEDVPRLVRGQPDTAWITAADARSKAVPFNHLAHEPLTRSCSDCHHRTLKACKECHTLTGSEEGAGVTMAQSYHALGSEHSCVGCHAANTSDSSCTGCHHQLGAAPGQLACTVCHSGPSPGGQALETPPAIAEVLLAALPAPSDDFPETVVIDGMANEYEPSTLPHAKIVAKLDAAVRQSPLAGRFHATTQTLCSGCHHNTPVGTRPPPCRSCHGDTAEATVDRPDLKAAYHRQCLGCHIEMGLSQQGCTDCHAAKGEVTS